MPLTRGGRLDPLQAARRTLTIVGVLTAVGCSASHPAVRVAPATATACTISPAGVATSDTLTIGTGAAIDPTLAPVATSSAERMVFPQLYASLLAVDCEGEARPALASSWTFDAARRRITLTLRGDARFADGTAVLAADVLAAWRATAARSDEARRIAERTSIVDDRTLTVSLPDTDWRALGDGAMGVYRPAAATPWTVGTGRYQVARQERGRLVLVPVASRTDPVLVARTAPSADPRDAIDASVDVLVTDDPVAVSYAEARGGYTAVPLPWTRTYALAVPRRPPGGPASLPANIDSPTFRASLAHDAVHAEARAADPPHWWTSDDGCGPGIPSEGAAGVASNRIVYPRDDRVARALAERLVALGRGVAAAGLAADDFARALHDGGDAAYVVALPRAPLSRCGELAALRQAAPWLPAGAGAGSPLVPLVDTRRRAIVHPDRVHATVLADGTLLFGGSGP